MGGRRRQGGGYMKRETGRWILGNEDRGRARDRLGRQGEGNIERYAGRWRQEEGYMEWDTGRYEDGDRESKTMRDREKETGRVRQGEGDRGTGRPGYRKRET